jgi:acetolactate decarboxylase
VTTHGQVEQTLSGIHGTLVGFRAPRYAQGTAVAGYHLHFIDASRTVGGHVLDFALESGSIALDLDADLHVEMPTTAALASEPVNAALDAEVEEAEGGGAR